MDKLFNPMYIKNTLIKNRICVPPMVCFSWSDERGIVSEKNVEHYRSIAKGGAGLIIQEGTCISPEGRLSSDQLGIWSDEHIAGLSKITAATHEYGCPVFVQIHHAGVVGISDEPLCPSAYTLTRGGTVKTGVEMTADDIDLVKQQFVDGCIRAWKAGYDGVELHGCHSFLLCQFMNKRVNKRSDMYGEDPLLIVQEIVAEIRKAVPDEFVIGIRLGGFEPSLKDGIAHVKQLEGCLDFLDISYGFAEEMDTFAPKGYPFQDIIYAAQEIKKAVSIPVFAVYGINTAKKASEILEATGVDMVDIGRCVLVNPNWANDAKTDKDTGKCLRCSKCMWFSVPEKCPGRKRFNVKK